MLWRHPDRKIISLLLHNCHFATIVNCNVNKYLICDPQMGHDPQVPNYRYTDPNLVDIFQVALDTEQ